MNVGSLEDFARVDFHVAASDVGKVDVKAGSHRHCDRHPGSLWLLGGNQPSDSWRLRVEDADVERKSVLVERSKQQRQLTGR